MNTSSNISRKNLVKLCFMLGIVLTVLSSVGPAFWTMPYRLGPERYTLQFDDANPFYQRQRGPGILFIGYTGRTPSIYAVHLNGRSSTGDPIKVFSSSGSLLQEQGIPLTDASGARIAWELRTGFPLLCTHLYSYGKYGESNGAVHGGIRARNMDRAAKFHNHAYHGYQPKVWQGAAGLLPLDINWIALLANAFLNSVSLWFAIVSIYMLGRFLRQYFISKLRELGWRSGRCWACGYDLSGLKPNRPCPECGRDVPHSG